MKDNGVLRVSETGCIRNSADGKVDRRYKEHNTKCKICGKTFRVRPSIIKKGNGIFCSRNCLSIYNMNNVQPEPNIKDPDLKDLMWAVGFYDGEGCISCFKNNTRNHTRIQVSVSQKKFDNEISDTLIKFKNIVGVGKIYSDGREYTNGNCDQFYICKYGEVKRFCRLFYPHISNYRKYQMKKTCDLYKEHTGRSIIDEKV